MTAPALDGIRIVDLTSVVFGPYCTLTLAEMGAEVIKLEAPPIGDIFRYSGPWTTTPGMGPGAFTLNRGKTSAALNLKDPEDKQTALDLIKTADVFIHNVRAEPIGRLGLDYDSVKAIKPDIVYVHCVGFGSDGPYAGMPAYDDVIQAASGATSLLPRVDGIDRPRYFPSLIADKVSGLQAVHATLGALFHRERTGEGQHVEVPMLESFTSFMMAEHIGGRVFDPPNAPAGYPRQVDPNRQPFPTQDGYVAIVPYTDGDLANLFNLLGAPEIMENEAFADQKSRAKHMSELYRQLGEQTKKFTTEGLLKMLREASIPSMPVVDLEDVQDDPHLSETGFFARREHPTEGGYIDMAHPIRYEKTPARKLHPPRHIGEDTEAVRDMVRKSDQ